MKKSHMQSHALLVDTNNLCPICILPKRQFSVSVLILGLTVLGETMSGESDEFLKISPDKVSPNKIITFCLNDLFTS